MYLRNLNNSELEKGIIQLIYCSHLFKANYQVTHKQVLESIMSFSAHRNSMRKITGALLTDGTFLAQVIEGPSSQVNQLYKVVLYDERHRNVTLLQRTVTNIRLIPQWSMALVEVDDMSYVGRLSVQSTPEDLRKARLSILKSLRPAIL